MVSLAFTLFKGSPPDERLNINETVTGVIKQEKEEYTARREKIDKLPFPKKPLRSEEEWEKIKKGYLEVERWTRMNKASLPSWEVAGPLDYGMTLEGMERAIKRKFKQMAANGKLLREDSISKDRGSYYPFSKGSNDMTRIWGADFLKEHLTGEKLTAADHYLVIEKGAVEIEVQVWHGDYPTLSSVTNAYVLANRIEGKKGTWAFWQSEELKECGYRDFADPGNILLNEESKGIVVDTEIKSFDPPPLKGDASFLQTYLKKRFKVLAGEQYNTLFQTFKIKVSDLGV